MDSVRYQRRNENNYCGCLFTSIYLSFDINESKVKSKIVTSAVYLHPDKIVTSFIRLLSAFIQVYINYIKLYKNR